MTKIAALVAVAASLAGCGSRDEASDDGRPQVVATATMAADLVRQIGGERVQVHGLMGPGLDPHSYTTRMSDVRRLESADLIVYVGLHLEGRMQDTLEAMRERGSRTLAIADAVPEERLLAPEEGFSGHYDPHIWGDPALWAEAVPEMVAALSEIDPEGAATFAERGRAYVEELRELERWARERVSEIPEERRVLVTSHDAFFYFGRAFGFEVRGLQGLSTVAEAGVRDRLELVELIRSRGLRTIFPETSVNAKGIEAVAREAGAQLSPVPLFSDSLGEPGIETGGGMRYDPGTYVGMTMHNVNAIVEGLK